MKSKIKILVADDDPDMQQTLQSVLKEKGYIVFLAGDGAEAVKMVREKNPDIVFLDMMLPVSVGSDVHHTINKISPKIVTVLMTGHHYEMKELIDEALKDGAHTCLYKPFNMDKVIEIVEKTRSRDV